MKHRSYKKQMESMWFRNILKIKPKKRRFMLNFTSKTDKKIREVITLALNKKNDYTGKNK